MSGMRMIAMAVAVATAGLAEAHIVINRAPGGRGPATTTAAPAENPRVHIERGPGGGWAFRLGQMGEMIKAAYLGIGTVPADEPVRKQLGLPDGVGLLVDHLDAEGPAKAAGVERLDVLHKLNDQLLINPEQLMVLVRTFKPGEEVKLTVIRQAKPQVLSVKLVEKEVPKAPPMLMPELNPWKVMPMQPGAMPGGMGGGMLRPEMRAGPGQRQPPRKHVEEENEQEEHEGFHITIPGLGGMGGTAGSATVAMDDGEHTLTLTTLHDCKTLVAKDKAGKVLFNGPVDTQEQRSAVPKDILQKLERMEKSTKVELKVSAEKDQERI